MAHVRDTPSLAESVVIVTPSGRPYRWSADELRAENVPSGERWSDTMPGGFESHDLTLPRKPGVDYADLVRLSTLTRYDVAGSIIWQGRLERAPKVSGDQVAISPSAVGWQAHLDDDQSVTMVGRDVDLSHWAGISSARKLAVQAANYRPIDGSVSQDETGSPAIVLEADGPWASNQSTEMWYDSGASDVASIYWDRVSQSDQASQPSATFVFAVDVASDSVGTGAQTSGDLHTSIADGEIATFTPTTPDRFTYFLWQFSGANATAGSYTSYVRRVAVYGNHGMTLRGSEPDAGYFDSDLIGYALTRWCPMLNYTSDTLTPSGFVIPHFVYLDPTTVSEVVRGATRFDLRDWAVWDDQTFWLHDRGARGRSWRANVGPAQLEETGPQVDRLWNGILVAYQDVDGTTRTVGPVGSGADTETSDLVDVDPENPANELGIRRWDMLTMGTSTPEGATKVGQRFLDESKVLDSSGRAVFVGHVRDDRGVLHPYSHMRAGDTVVFTDASDTSARRVVRTEKSRDERSCSVDIDSPPEGLQALLERLDVSLVSLGF